MKIKFQFIQSCLWCEKEMKTIAEGYLFCSEKCRKELNKQVPVGYKYGKEYVEAK